MLWRQYLWINGKRTARMYYNYVLKLTKDKPMWASLKLNFGRYSIMSLIPTALVAETVAPATSSGQFNFMSFLPMIVIFVLFWFLLIRPQQRKAKAHNKMLTELQKGEEVISSGGIVGKVVKVTDQFVLLEIANNVIITVQKSTIASKVEPGTLTKVAQ